MNRFGKYEIISQLGRGTVGTVYRARDATLQRDVALKLLNEIHADDPELKERFHREARACARLKHPGIVTLYDFGEMDGVPYMVMELLEGQDLRAMRLAGRVFTAGAALEIMEQLCAALAHAHSAGIVHRDIKPSNIFIQHDGAAKVLDFGIARLADSELTRAGRALGTPDYMAPEQILGRPCEPRSDIFSAAIVAFELLAGIHPFGASNIPRRIVQGVPERLSALKSDLPLSLDSVFEKALAAEPAKRYQTAGEFAAALHAAGEEIHANPHAMEIRDHELDALFQRAARDPEPVSLEPAPLRSPPPEPAMTPPSALSEATRILPRQEAEQALAAEPATEPSRRGGRRLAWLAAAIFVTAVPLYFGYGRMRGLFPRTESPAPLPARPAAPIATARVLSEATDMFDAPSASGKRLARLARDTVVEFSRLPLSADQEWAAVNAPANRSRSTAGYVRLAELGDWSGNSPESSLRLLEIFAPPEHSAEAQAEQRIAKLRALLPSIQGGPLVGRARLDDAALSLRLAGAQSRRSLPFESWRAYLDAARADLEAAASEPALRPEVARARIALDAIVPPAPEPRPAPGAREPLRVESTRPARGNRADLAQVEKLWQAGQYTAASRELSAFEARYPNNTAARAWRERLDAAQRVETESGR